MIRKGPNVHKKKMHIVDIPSPGAFINLHDRISRVRPILSNKEAKPILLPRANASSSA